MCIGAHYFNCVKVEFPEPCWKAERLNRSRSLRKYYIKGWVGLKGGGWGKRFQGGRDLAEK